MESDEDIHVPEITVDMIRSIASLKHNVDISESEIPSEMIRLCLQTIQSDSVTPAEQALGHSTRRELEGLGTWPLWEKGEHKQLNQFHEQKMFGDPIDPSSLDEGSIILRPHWQYAAKGGGARRPRQCCCGPKRAAPQLHAGWCCVG